MFGGMGQSPCCKGITFICCSAQDSSNDPQIARPKVTLLAPRLPTTKDIQSSPVEGKYGVPHGSVLGPKLFTIYTSPIADIARRYGWNIHLYADDTQIYIALETSSSTGEQVAIENIKACISEIRSWMLLNKLQLNYGKT